MSLKYGLGIFNIQTEEVNMETDKIVSFSQYSRYKKCPKSWELNYVRKQKISNESISFVYGQAMHSTIQMFIHTCYTKSVKAANQFDINAFFLEELKTEYKTRMEKNGSHFSSKDQLTEYYLDGIEILKFLKSKRTRYFSTKGTKLIAIELPIVAVPDKNRPNIKLQQHLDLVLYDTITKKYKIVDIKTAKTGWNQYKRKDKSTTNQLVLYKKEFCEKYKIDPDNVEIEYFILRQKIDPDSLWPIKRISQFSPASGRIAMGQLQKDFKSFLDECFDDKGQYIDKSHPAITGRRGFNCTYCEYNDREDLCPKSNRMENV